MKKVIKLENLDCANCGMLLERTIAKIDGVTAASVNFMAQKLIVEYNESNVEILIQGHYIMHFHLTLRLCISYNGRHRSNRCQ